jgi:acyl carrier protein
MTAQEAGLEGTLRQRVVDVMITVLPNLLDRADPVTEDMRLMEELGLSSTLGLELLLRLEDELEILIDVEQLDQEQMRTVGDMATFVAGHCRPA